MALRYLAPAGIRGLGHIHGIGALLTRPETLTVDAVNKYLELKAHGAF